MNSDFDSFNARNLRAQDVAATFVESEDFGRVCGNWHSIILGPRGSGKTTLLKMLTLPAIAAWRERRAKSFVLSFTAVYIPTDIVWHHQLLDPATANLDQDFLRRVSQGAILISVMGALLEAFIDRLRYESFGEGDAERILSEHLIRAWQLPPSIPKLSEIYLAVKERTIELSSLMSKAKSPSLENALPLLPEWCDTDFLAVADFAVTAFDSSFNLDREARWALCFDELELAPLWLQGILFRLQRSTSQKLLFKLSSSPDPEIFSSIHVQPSDDLDLVKLWRSSMVTRREFCHDLALSVLRRRNVNCATPEEFFGASDEHDFEKEDSQGGPGPYAEGSSQWAVIRDVASWDQSLANLLRSKGIDPLNPTVQTFAEKDSVLRKVMPIAALRRKFSKGRADGTLVRRSRKSGGGFYGVPAVYDLSDGNPRRLIRICENLCREAQKSGGNRTPMVSREAQSRVILSVAYLYKDYLKMIPGSQVVMPGGRTAVHLYDFIREIGRFFSSGLLIGPFPLDPKGSFTIDEKITDELVSLLRIASYHGAIIKIDPSEGGFSNEMRGCRFRLCFTLSPLLQLPLRLYDPISLSSCLHNMKRVVRPVASESAQQLQFSMAHESR